jgi:hypothetical protein
MDVIDFIGTEGEALEGQVKPKRIVGTVLKWFADVAVKLLERFLGGPRDGETFLRTEEELLRTTAALGGRILAGTVAALQRDQQWRDNAVGRSRRALDNPGAQRLRSLGIATTVVYFLGGVCMRLATPYYLVKARSRVGRRRGVGRRGPAGKGHYPLLEALGIHNKVTPALASEVARQSARGASFAEAQKALAERGCDLDTKTVRRVALRVGTVALEQRQARIEAAKRGEVYSSEFAGKRLALGTDGGRVRTREGGKRGRRGKKGRRRFRTPWREPKLVNAYTFDDEGKQSSEAVPLYDGTLGDADAAFEILVTELKLRGAAKATLLVLTGDGAVWIWNRADDLARELGVPRERIIKVVDFYHAVENLGSAADDRAWSAAKRRRWVRRQRRLLHAGKIDAVIEAIRALCVGRNAKKVAVHLRYFEDRREFMTYDAFRKKGIPCGSGATESAIRRVVNLRLKGPGIFWEPANAERMLHLRAHLKAGRWDELMLRVIHRTPHGRPSYAETLCETGAVADRCAA